MSAAFRFVHASDLHLEALPGGLTEVPDHLRPLLADAPFRAAQRVFDTAVSRQADFLVLSGDVLDPSAAGARGLATLIEQFDRLAARGMAVYWACGRADTPRRWPAGLQLPENVHIFQHKRIESIIHVRAGEPIAQVLGSSREQKRPIRAADFKHDEAELFTLAVAYGQAEPANLQTDSIDYWALGGEHARRSLTLPSGVAHYPGSPQGRRPRELGPHGCTVVDVDDACRVRTSFVATDELRWLSEDLVLHRGATRGQLERLLLERAELLASSTGGPTLMVEWRVGGEGELVDQLRRGKLAAELLSRLRAEHGHKQPALWSTRLTGIDEDAAPAELIEQETILGEFLRSVRQYASDDAPPIDLQALLGERQLTGALAKLIDLADPSTRARVLGNVARLGVELLGPEEAAT